MNTNVGPNRFNCPAWCEGHDAESVEWAEQEGQVRHMAGIGGDILMRLTNPFSGQVHRDDQIAYDVDVSMEELPTGQRLGEFINVDISVNAGRADKAYQRHELRLAPGEARTMAAILLAAADRLDIAGRYVPPATHRYRWLASENLPAGTVQEGRDDPEHS